MPFKIEVDKIVLLFFCFCFFFFVLFFSDRIRLDISCELSAMKCHDLFSLEKQKNKTIFFSFCSVTAAL